MSEPLSPKQRNAQKLYEQLSAAIERHRFRKQNPELDRQVRELAYFQANRLLKTYADLYRSDSYRKAVLFFTDDMYGPKDYSQRDMDAKKVYPLMSRVLPASMIGTLATVMELNSQTMALDEAMVKELNQLGGTDDINEENYAEAFRRCDNREARDRQLKLVIQVGKELERYVRMPYVSGALKLARKPAHLLGLEALQDVLERGYSCYKDMGKADEFLFQIEDRESKIMDNIFAGRERPFDIEFVPIKAS
ncbi:MAG: FFLEELY motif protein [Pseudomonadota bacterium]